MNNHIPFWIFNAIWLDVSICPLDVILMFNCSIKVSSLFIFVGLFKTTKAANNDKAVTPNVIIHANQPKNFSAPLPTGCLTCSTYEFIIFSSSTMNWFYLYQKNAIF